MTEERGFERSDGVLSGCLPSHLVTAIWLMSGASSQMNAVEPL